jgi:hypothetical protein
MEPAGTGVFGFKQVGTALADYSLPSMQLVKTTKINFYNAITWGIWVMQDGKYTYIYGNNKTGDYVARVLGNDVYTGTWQYYTGTGWATNVAKAAQISIVDPTTNDYSVAKLDGVYVLFSMAWSPFGATNQLMTYFSCSPVGPFTNAELSYSTVGQTGTYGTYGDANVFTYTAYVHPELTDGNTMVVSYDVNSYNQPDIYSNVYLYRPRYVNVTFNFNG